MARIRFRKIVLRTDQTIEEWLIENETLINENTRYTFFNCNQTEVLGEYIGNVEVTTGGTDQPEIPVWVYEE